MIDILYIKGKESKNYDTEMLCSLRSVQKYATDLGRIFVTGECPQFIDKSKITYTQIPDIGCPAINHWWKVYNTIKKTNISTNFVLMYDDIFFLKPVKLSRILFYQKGILGESKTGGEAYQKMIEQTKQYLIHKGFTINDHELHMPCIYNKKLFMKLENVFAKYKNDKYGLAVRSVYANSFKYKQPFKEDVKVRDEKEFKEFKKRKEMCVSTSDASFPFLVGPFLEKHMTERSKWEYDNCLLYR